MNEDSQDKVTLRWKLPLATIVFTICVAPMIITYQPYLFRWDDSDYLWRSIIASRAFWSGNRHMLGIAMRGIRPPIMSLLAVPWGRLNSWTRVGECFVSLNVLTAMLIACCLYLLLRIGLKPIFLAIGSVCVFAALGPYPKGAEGHFFSTSLLVDSLFAWNAFASLLLISYEATNPSRSTRDDIARGILWAFIFSMGALTKVSFWYFLALVVPIVLIVRARRSGLRSAVWSTVTLAVCSLPVAIYLIRYGLPALFYGWGSAFGHTASFYHIPFWDFVKVAIQRSPGLPASIVFVAVCLVYWASRRFTGSRETDFVPILVLVGYCAITLLSPNRELRFVFVAVIALPFLMALSAFGRAPEWPQKSAMIAALLVFCFLAAAGVPMLHRPDEQGIGRSEAILNEAADLHARRILLGTDSSSLNWDLLLVAQAFSPSQSTTATATLANNAADGEPIEEDFREIRESDLIAFQDKDALDSDFTNQRAAQYEAYARQQFGNPVKVVGDIRIYCTRSAALYENPKVLSQNRVSPE